MSEARTVHRTLLLPGERVLITGGYDGVHFLASAELYETAAGTFAATNGMRVARNSHTMTLLPGGKALIAGGYDGTISPRAPSYTSRVLAPRRAASAQMLSTQMA
jgi:hypothetical protein